MRIIVIIINIITIIIILFFSASIIIILFFSISMITNGSVKTRQGCGNIWWLKENAILGWLSEALLHDYQFTYFESFVFNILVLKNPSGGIFAFQIHFSIYSFLRLFSILTTLILFITVWYFQVLHVINFILKEIREIKLKTIAL